MDKEANRIPPNTRSVQCATANRKQIIKYLSLKVNEQDDRITNAQQEIAATKTIINGAKQRLERLKNANRQLNITRPN